MSNIFPKITAILAMSLDGKISTHTNKPARFSSSEDLAHLEKQISLCDAIVFGANTLRAYGTSLTIKNPELLQQRKKLSLPPQPLHIVCSASGKLDPNWRFFSQPIPRALLTNEVGKQNWRKQIEHLAPNVQEDIFFPTYFISKTDIKWQEIIYRLNKKGYQKIAILGGAKLIYSLLQENLIDDIWLTICPLVIGGEEAPKLFHDFQKPLSLKLLELTSIDSEIFAHYLINNDP